MSKRLSGMEQEYVFIVGCARTGTTLLRQILSKSSHVSIAPETHYLRRFSQAGGWKSRQWGDLTDERNLNRMIDFMYSGREIAGSAYWAWLRRNVDRQSFAKMLSASDRTERSIFQILIETYAEKTKGGTSDLMLGEKTPAHLNYIPTLLEWFPNAKVIHTFRDPRAILVSELKKMRKKGREGPKHLIRFLPNWLLEPLELPFELVHTTRSWLDAAHWHARYQERYPDNYRLLRFEDLVSQPERRIRQLCEFLGVEFVPAMITDIHVVGSSEQRSHKSAAGFDPSALDRWKIGLPPALQLWFALVGGQQMKEFGYLK